MQELVCKFTPDDGGPPRDITLRLGAPVREPQSWSVVVEILGFETPHVATTHGEDWAQVQELAAMVLPRALALLVSGAGGGTLDPPFYEREKRPPTSPRPPSPP